MLCAFLFVIVSELIVFDYCNDTVGVPSVKNASDYTEFAALIGEYGSELWLRRMSEINEFTDRSSNMY